MDPRDSDNSRIIKHATIINRGDEEQKPPINRSEEQGPPVKRWAPGDVFFAGDFKFTLQEYLPPRDAWRVLKETHPPGLPYISYMVTLTPGEIHDLKDRHATELGKKVNAHIPPEPPPPAPKVYERAKDTAAKLRKTLKKEFPGIKFSVRSEEYAGGNSVSITYVDGPALRKVKHIAGAYESAAFDAMQDLKTCPGYTDPETGERVSGADWVQVHREYTKAVVLRAVRAILTKYGRDETVENPREAADIYEPGARHSFLMLAYNELAEQDLEPYSGKVARAYENDDIA